MVLWKLRPHECRHAGQPTCAFRRSLDSVTSSPAPHNPLLSNSLQPRKQSQRNRMPSHIYPVAHLFSCNYSCHQTSVSDQSTCSPHEIPHSSLGRICATPCQCQNQKERKVRILVLLACVKPGLLAVLAKSWRDSCPALAARVGRRIDMGFTTHTNNFESMYILTSCPRQSTHHSLTGIKISFAGDPTTLSNWALAEPWLCPTVGDGLESV